jgi:hypothetical protein
MTFHSCFRWETPNSNPLGPIKLSSESEIGRGVNKYDLTVFLRLFQGFQSCVCFQGPICLPVDLLDSTDEPHLTFPVQDHILTVGGIGVTPS